MSTEAEVRLQQSYQDAIKQGKRIEAIKCYRLMHDCNFKEASVYIQINWARLRREYCK